MAACKIGSEHYEKVLLADPATGKPYRMGAEQSAPVRVFGLMWQTDASSMARYAALMAIDGADIPWRTACGRDLTIGAGIARTVTLEAIAHA